MFAVDIPPLSFLKPLLTLGVHVEVPAPVEVAAVYEEGRGGVRVVLAALQPQRHLVGDRGVVVHPSWLAHARLVCLQGQQVHGLQDVRRGRKLQLGDDGDTASGLVEPLHQVVHDSEAAAPGQYVLVHVHAHEHLIAFRRRTSLAVHLGGKLDPHHVEVLLLFVLEEAGDGGLAPVLHDSYEARVDPGLQLGRTGGRVVVVKDYFVESHHLVEGDELGEKAYLVLDHGADDSLPVCLLDHVGRRPLVAVRQVLVVGRPWIDIAISPRS
mmetsp:Transcript_2942/g.6817  ORF Transcript_2942/g.6817 Transcript_2942/m.6817 type:complete len:268 (+) Transcript_2942:803-1606(+)